MNSTLIVSVGEVVWDQFPDGAVLGGAPLNVAYHLQARGLNVLAISRLGNDELAQLTRSRITELGLSSAGMQQDEEQPTGQVLVQFDEQHEPHFDIAQPAAWDFLELAEIQPLLAEQPYHLVFGTLGQRAKQSRQVIQQLWQRAESCFYDVNLRPPFTTAQLVEPSLQAAQVVKVNEEELFILADWFTAASGKLDQVALALIKAFDISLLAVTRGAAGAVLVTSDQLVSHPGFQVQVADTVGSGDAFFSGVINGYLAGEKLEKLVAEANRLGSYVASRPGATPTYE